jgi:hypothetical protein
MTSNDFIGGTKDTIESLLAEGASGGITRELFDHDDHKTTSMVEFTIMPITEASDAAGLNMGEAVAQGKDVLDRMKLVSSMFQRIRGATDVSGTVTNNMKPLSAVWGPLLQKIKIFTELVDEIAEVREQIIGYIAGL